MPARLLATLALSISLTASAEAKLIYVNNHAGSDQNDGRAEVKFGRASGPVRTIARALALTDASDGIVLANTGHPYFESVSLFGSRHSGTSTQPFRIIGNGAVLSGALSVPDTAWEPVGADVWRMRPQRKGLVLLLHHGRLVTETRPASGEAWPRLPALDPQTWAYWKGAIYYQSEPRISPASHAFGIAQHDCGITLYNVRHIVISDLTVQHFRIDGVNAHDLSKGIVLERARLLENGRAGLCVAGSSSAALVESTAERNRFHAVLIREQAELDVRQSILDVEPQLE